MVSGGLNDEGPPEVDVPDVLESEAGVNAGVGWAGIGGAGLDTSGGVEKGQMGQWHHHFHFLGPPG